MSRDELERELARLHGESFGWAMACCGRSREAAEDVLQTAYLRVVSGSAQFNGRSTPRTWFFGVIRMAALELTRKERSIAARTTGPEALDEISSPEPQTDVVPVETISKALAALPGRQREVAQLVFYHGLTVEESAAVMGVSAGTARTHYDRAKKALSIALRKEMAP